MPSRARVAELSRWYDAQGDVIDRGLQLFFPAPHSYTGEDVVEFHAHGNPVLLRALVDRLITLGAVPAQAGEFTRRAVHHGRMDLAQAEAVAATIDAATLRAARQAQRQLDGRFGRFIGAQMESLTDLMARVEACLDFSNEDLPPLTMRQLRADAEALQERLQCSLASALFGERLFSGVAIAIVGAPNVGKSTLLNALAGRERAIVSAQAGTTRDLLEVDLDLAGFPVRLFDTAGLHASDDPVECEGMRRARDAAQRADLVLLVADATRPESWNSTIPGDIRLMNKCDLVREGQLLPDDFLAISAGRGEGIDALVAAITARIDDGSFSGEEDAVITHARHRHAVARALDGLQRGLDLLDDEEMFDLVAAEWRGSWLALGEILGIGDVEHILDRLFSSFCIGK